MNKGLGWVFVDDTDLLYQANKICVQIVSSPDVLTYSIASPPGDDSRFALCLNRVQERVHVQLPLRP